MYLVAARSAVALSTINYTRQCSINNIMYMIYSTSSPGLLSEACCRIILENDSKRRNLSKSPEEIIWCSTISLHVHGLGSMYVLVSIYLVPRVRNYLRDRFILEGGEGWVLNHFKLSQIFNKNILKYL